MKATTWEKLFKEHTFRGMSVYWGEGEDSFWGFIAELKITDSKQIEIQLKQIHVRNNPDEEWIDHICPVRTVYFNGRRSPQTDGKQVTFGHGGVLTARIPFERVPKPTETIVTG